MLFTQADVDGLLAHMAARRTPQSPADATPGHVVFLGDRIRKDSDIFMGWAPINGVDQLLRRVQLGAQSPADLLDYAPATYGQYLAYRDRVAKDRVYGNWYYRTPEFDAFVASLLPDPSVRNDDNEIDTTTETVT